MNTMTNNKGFTLVEILVALAISSMLMLALLTVMIASSKSYDETSGEVTLENESQTAMNFLSNIISKAQYIEYHNQANFASKKRYMVELEEMKLGKSDPTKESERWSNILGDVIDGYTYLAIGTDFNYKETETKYSMVMHYFLYDGNKLYYYKDTENMKEIASTLSSVNNDDLRDEKQDILSGIVAGGNKNLFCNYVATTDGFSITFDEEVTNDDANNDILENLKVNVKLNLSDTDRKYSSSISVVPRNNIVYIY